MFAAPAGPSVGNRGERSPRPGEATSLSYAPCPPPTTYTLLGHDPVLREAFPALPKAFPVLRAAFPGHRVSRRRRNAARKARVAAFPRLSVVRALARQAFPRGNAALAAGNGAQIPLRDSESRPRMAKPGGNEPPSRGDAMRSGSRDAFSARSVARSTGNDASAGVTMREVIFATAIRAKPPTKIGSERNCREIRTTAPATVSAK